MWAAVACLVLAAAGEILPGADAIAAVDVNKILAQPLLFLGGLDLFVAVMLGLGVVSFYPFVRFRAALGFGLYGFIFAAQGPTLGLLAVTAGSAGLFLVTMWVDMLPVLIAASLGTAGAAGVALSLSQAWNVAACAGVRSLSIGALNCVRMNCLHSS